MLGLNTNLLDQLTFYGSYHRNKWNQVIHFVFVPVLIWTVLVWLSYSGPLAPTPHFTAPSYVRESVEFNAAFFVTLAYCSFYLVLDFFAGLSWSACMGLPLWLSATLFQHSVPHAGLWALGLHIFAWYMQIHPGHAILEKRKPALLDSLVQAFALAPLFVWFELLFLLRYRPGLYQELQKRIEERAAGMARQQEQQQGLLNATAK